MDEEAGSGRRPPRMDRTGQLGAGALDRMREPGRRDQAAGGRLLVVRSGRVADRESGARTGPKSSAARRSVRAVAIRCSTPTLPGFWRRGVGLRARRGKVAQIGSAAVTIAEALIRPGSRRRAHLCDPAGGRASTRGYDVTTADGRYVPAARAADRGARGIDGHRGVAGVAPGGRPSRAGPLTCRPGGQPPRWTQRRRL
jgi:hypothetical protein